jgi:hypothetical protein
MVFLFLQELENFVLGFHFLLYLKGQVPGDQFINGDSNAPDVTLFCLFWLALFQDFWRHIMNCADDCSFVGLLLVEDFGQTKVRNLDCLAFEKDVLRFYVPMYDTLFFQITTTGN